jgi:hypothetical protein
VTVPSATPRRSASPVLGGRASQRNRARSVWFVHPSPRPIGRDQPGA